MSQTETQPENSSAPAADEQIRKIYTKDLKVGESVQTVFKATRKERHASRAGKPYLVIGLVDRTGEVDARVFDNVEAAEGAFAVGDYLLLTGKVGHFHGHPQIIIERLERLDPDPIDPAEFAYTAPPPSEKPPKAEKKNEKTERGEKAEEPGSHKAARQRLLRLLDNPQVAQALDLLVTHLERYIDDRVAQKLGQPRPERRPKGPKVEHKGEVKADAKPEAKETPKREALPEGLAFKPFSQLVGAGNSTGGPSEG
ncbi:MAG: OB-fold nucleic acid binding domain-containing protein [Myxococcota bacterium]